MPGTSRTEFSLPRDGNDPPFGPPSGMEPDDVAAAIVAQLRSGDFEAFGCDDYAQHRRRQARATPMRFLAAVAAIHDAQTRVPNPRSSFDSPWQTKRRPSGTGSTSAIRSR